MSKVKSIKLLLSTNTVETDEVKIQGYLIGVSEFDDKVVEQAVLRFVQGKVENHNQSFCPNSAQLATECRKLAGEYVNPDSTFGKFMAASKLNKIKTDREDAEFNNGRDHKFLDNPKVKKAGRILTDKTRSSSERLKALEDMKSIKTGSQFEPSKAEARKNG